MFKKIISLGLACIMLMGTSTSALAAEEKNLVQTRYQNGLQVESSISVEDIENLSDGMIAELQKDPGTIVSVSTTYFDLESGMETMAVMPKSDFELTVVATRINEKSGDNYKFVACGKWIVNPFYEFTDGIGISWSDEFTLYEDYGYTYSKNSSGIPFYNFDAVVRNEVVPEAGVAHDVDLNLGDRQDEIYLIAKVYKDDSSGSANVIATYGHVVIRPSSIDVSISSGKEIGMSVGLASDIEMASPDYDYFNY